MARSVGAYSIGISTKDIDYKFSSWHNLEVHTYILQFQSNVILEYIFVFSVKVSPIYWVDQENLVFRGKIDNQKIFLLLHIIDLLVAKIIFGYASWSKFSQVWITWYIYITLPNLPLSHIHIKLYYVLRTMYLLSMEN